MTKSNILHSVMLCLLIAICYVNVLGGPFLWDDESLVVTNEGIRSMANIPSFFSLTSWPTEYKTFYRPLQLTLYTLEYTLWKDAPFGYHLINVILHMIGALLLYAFLVLITKRIPFSFLSTLLFAVHPLHTEAVSYIAGSADILAFIFLVATAMAFYVYLQKHTFLLFISCILFYACALFSKEISIVLPIIFLLWFGKVLIAREEVKGRILFYATIGMALLMVLLKIVLQGSAPLNIYDFSFLERVRVGIIALSQYVMYMFFPIHLHMEHIIFPPASLYDMTFIRAIGITMIVILGAIVSMRRSRQAYFGLIWFFVFLFPVLNIIVPINATFSEHWLYIPFVGICITLVPFFEWGEKKISRKGVIAVVGIVALLFSVRTMIRNREWADPIRFYTAILKYSPNNTKIHYNLGNVFLREGNLEKAIYHYEQVLYIIRAKELRTMGQGAEVLLHTLLVKTYNNLGTAYARQGLILRARLTYEKALALDPYHESSIFNAVNVYVVLGEWDHAQALLRQFLIDQPDNVHAKKILLHIIEMSQQV